MRQEHIDRIRSFNRYYTKLLGVLNRYCLGSEFGLPEVRVIRSVYLHPGCCSKDISAGLNMDKGLLSRLLKRLEQKALVCRHAAEGDGRAERIGLTEKGCGVYRRLDAAAGQSVRETFAHLDDRRLRELLGGMDSIRRAMNPAESDSPAGCTGPVVLRPVGPEDDAQLARVLRASVEEHDAPRVGTFYDDPHTDRMFETFSRGGAEYWVVECDGVVSGGGGFYPTEGLPAGYAELSKFHFLPELRGRGVGKHLLRFIERRAVRAGYTHLYIVSYPQFEQAVAMYEKYGYGHLPAALDRSGLYKDAPFHMVKRLRENA